MDEYNVLDVPFEFETKGEKRVDDTGYFIGYASTFGGKPDSYGDVIAQGAFADSLGKNGANGLGVKMLWQHQTDKPIGVYTSLAENARGLRVEGQLALGTQLGREAYELMKMGALSSMSIGYNPIEWEDDSAKKTRLLKKVDLWEISLVTFPANTRATITHVKAVIEEAKNERELEEALREVGLSKSAALYIVKLCRPGLRREEGTATALKAIESALRQNAIRI